MPFLVCFLKMTRKNAFDRFASTSARFHASQEETEACSGCYIVDFRQWFWSGMETQLGETKVKYVVVGLNCFWFVKHRALTANHDQIHTVFPTSFWSNWVQTNDSIAGSKWRPPPAKQPKLLDENTKHQDEKGKDKNVKVKQCPKRSKKMKGNKGLSGCPMKATNSRIRQLMCVYFLRPRFALNPTIVSSKQPKSRNFRVSPRLKFWSKPRKLTAASRVSRMSLGASRITKSLLFRWNHWNLAVSTPFSLH